MFTVFDVEIGTLAFFTFSFVAGVFIVLQAVFWAAKETMVHRVVQGVVGMVYAMITVLAFMQLEGVKSPYVDIGSETGTVETDATASGAQ